MQVQRFQLVLMYKAADVANAAIHAVQTNIHEAFCNQAYSQYMVFIKMLVQSNHLNPFEYV